MMTSSFGALHASFGLPQRPGLSEVLSGEAWVMPSKIRVVYEGRRKDAASLATLAFQPWTLAAQTLTLWTMMSLSMLGATSTTRR